MSAHSNKSVMKKTSSAGLLNFFTNRDDVENVDPSSCTSGKQIAGELRASKGRSTSASRLPRLKARYPLRTLPSASTTSAGTRDNFSPNTNNAQQIPASQKNIKQTQILTIKKTVRTIVSKESLSKTDDSSKSNRKALSLRLKMSPGATEIAHLTRHVTRRRDFNSPSEWNISSVNACAIISDTDNEAPKAIKLEPEPSSIVPGFMVKSEKDDKNYVVIDPNTEFNPKFMKNLEKCSTPIEEQTKNIDNHSDVSIPLQKQEGSKKDLNNHRKYLAKQFLIPSSFFKHVTCRRVFTPTDWPPFEPAEHLAEEATNTFGTRTHVTQFLRRERMLPEDTAGCSNPQPAFTPSQDPELSLTSLNETKGLKWTPYAPLDPKHCPEDTYIPKKRVKFSLARTKSRERKNVSLSTPLSPRMPSFQDPPMLPRRAPSLARSSPPASLPTLVIYQGLPEVGSIFPTFPGTVMSEIAETGEEPGIVNFDDKAPAMDKALLYSSEYIENIMVHLQRREEMWQASEALPTYRTITEINRSILVNWLIKLNNHMKGDVGLLEAGVRLVDRALALAPVPLHSVQLLATACYWIARKQRAARPGAASRLVRYCNGAYTPHELIAEECRLMRALDWPALPPSSDCWVHYLVLRAGARDATVVALAAHYLLCGALLDASLASVKPSRLANAGVTAALHLLEGRPTPMLAKCAAKHDESPCVNKENFSNSLVCELFSVALKLRSPAFPCREPFFVYSHDSRRAVALRISAALDCWT